MSYVSLHSIDLLMKGSHKDHYLCKISGKINGCISSSSHSPLIFTAVNESLLILSGRVISISFIEAC